MVVKLKNILFLDIDGVICTRRSLCRTMANYFGMDFNEEYWIDPDLHEEKKHQMNEIYAVKMDWKDKDKQIPSWSMSNWPMDRMCINNLNEIVDQTDCDIILSSSWRYGRDEPFNTNRILRENGLNVDLKGKTSTNLSTSERGLEIQHWLDNNQWDNYVIIDDDYQDIYGHHPDNLVITSFDVGLTNEKKKLVIDILNG